MPGTTPRPTFGEDTEKKKRKKEMLAVLESCCQASSTNTNLPYVLQSTLPHRDPQDLAPARKTKKMSVNPFGLIRLPR